MFLLAYLLTHLFAALFGVGIAAWFGRSKWLGFFAGLFFHVLGDFVLCLVLWLQPKAKD